MKLTITITEVTEWGNDYPLILGDASHEGDYAVKCHILEEEEIKTESDIWNKQNLPLTFTADCDAEGDDIEDLVYDICEDKLRELCENDYLKPTEFDYSYEEKKGE